MNSRRPAELFVDRLPGRAHLPGSEGYDRATRPLNSNSAQTPALVVAAAAASDVQACLRTASETGLRVHVQATGHGAGGPFGSESVLLDTAALDGVDVDPARRVVRAGAGATFGAINAAAFEHGLLALGGTAPDVAVAGYTALGGVGWLTRPYGLASASLLAVDVVDGTGNLVRTDDERYADALWAYRGGGGVGVATQLELTLFPAEQLWAGYLLWPVDQANEIIPAWGNALSRFDSAVTTAMSVLHAPDAPAIPPGLRGTVVVHLSAASVGGEDAIRTLVDVLRPLPVPAFNSLGPADAARLSGIHLDPPAAVPAVGEGRWLTAAAGPIALDILTAAGTTMASPVAEVELRHVAAPPNKVSGALTQCPGDLVLHATGAGPDPDARRTTQAALDSILAAAAPADTGRQAAAFRDGQPEALEALEPVARERLRRVRAAIDPAGSIAVARPLDP